MMRATSESPALFLARQTAEPEPELEGKSESDRDEETTEAPSEFAATLGLITANVIVPPYTPEESAAAPVGEVSASTGTFETLPRPSGFDISSFDLAASDEPVALPLEAALQQLTATVHEGPAVPESEPMRVITAAHEVVEVVSRHVVRGEPRITMVLEPAELGAVKVRVEHVRGDQVRVTLEAERPEATQLLRERVPELQAALQQEGVVVRSIDVSLQASDGMGQRGSGGDAPPQHQSAEQEESAPDDTTGRPPKRTKRNPKDLDVLV